MTNTSPESAAAPGPTVPAPGAGDSQHARGGSSRRGKRRPLWIAAAVAVIALAAGLVIWAPWRPPPLLRPAGRVAGPATASSVSFHWAAPATGPAPDWYVILYGGAVIGSVRGTLTSYTDGGLYPGTAYTYQVAAVRGGMRSVPSAEVVLRTVTPPLAAARWQGPWTVHVKITHGGAALTGPRPLRWDDYWQASPQCTAGACTVRVHGTFNGHDFNAVLIRAGAVYTGTTVANSITCGPPHQRIPQRSTLKIRVRLTGASGGPDGAWTARTWTGTLQASIAYASTAAFYCSAFHLTAALTAG